MRFDSPPFIAAAVMIAGNAAAAKPPETPERKMQEGRASGTFDVELTPNSAADAAIGSMAIAKTFHGDLDGSSRGQMLSVRTAVAGSAGYVAMERVTATLAGKRGSFALQHSGSLDKGAQALTITVVPDSGTDGLAGLAGAMNIIIDDGKHLYTFTYALPKQP